LQQIFTDRLKRPANRVSSHTPRFYMLINFWTKQQEFDRMMRLSFGRPSLAFGRSKMRGRTLQASLVIAILLCLKVFANPPAKVIYVDDDAVGANDGTSWQNAYNFLQDALGDARSSDTVVEIRVAQGTYKPDQGENQTPGDREATLQLINGVTLKGGYAGFSEPDPNSREITLYESILSGDLAGNDTAVGNPRYLFCQPDRLENSYHVVNGSSTNNSAILDGFTITGGNANDEPQTYGGGMYIYSASPYILNCVFLNNSAGGDDIAESGVGGAVYNQAEATTFSRMGTWRRNR
jgi:hypothetical protein